MSTPRGLKQKLAAISRLWDAQSYDEAFAEVESLLEIWPGNAHLHVLWAHLVQLRDNPEQSLDDAKQALQLAMELDKGSPEAAIELGHFLDNVEDDPLAASKAFAEGVVAARRLLIQGLIGQAKAYRQLDKREPFLRCLREVLTLTRYESGEKSSKGDEFDSGLVFELPTGQFHALGLKGLYADQIRELLSDEVMNQSV